jgi:hypothetical protein
MLVRPYLKKQKFSVVVRVCIPATWEAEEVGSQAAQKCKTLYAKQTES